MAGQGERLVDGEVMVCEADGSSVMVSWSLDRRRGQRRAQVRAERAGPEAAVVAGDLTVELWTDPGAAELSRPMTVTIEDYTVLSGPAEHLRRVAVAALLAKVCEHMWTLPPDLMAD